MEEISQDERDKIREKERNQNKSFNKDNRRTSHYILIKMREIKKGTKTIENKIERF